MVFSLLDLIFPKRCVSCSRFGVYICSNCFSRIELIDKPVCPICQRQAIGGKIHPGCRGRGRLDGLVVVCRYRGPVKKAIAKVKYKLVYDIEKVFVDLIADNLWRFDLPKDLTLMSVPLHPKRKRWRGFNQAEILARSLSKSFGVPFADTMIRIIETKTQVGLKREKRKGNVRGAFALRLAPLAQVLDSEVARTRRGRTIADVKGKNIVLVDDVYTSGATMAECCRVLKKAGAGEVWGLAVALG